MGRVHAHNAGVGQVMRTLVAYAAIAVLVRLPGQVAMLPSMLGAMLMRGEKYSGVPGRGAHLLEGPA